MRKAERKVPAEPAPGHRCGTVAIVGRPNVGKSTLLNHLVGQKISITSRKAQTTRHRIHGIRTDADVQFVFVDTPGFQTSHANALSRIMNRSVSHALAEVDAVVWVVDALRVDERDILVHEVIPADAAVVVVLNKIDRLSDKGTLLPLLERLSALRKFVALVPVSARHGDGFDGLLSTLRELMPEGPPMFEADQVTDRSERFFAAEFVREQLFRLLGEELPYATTVVIDTFEKSRGVRRIYATIVVDKANQKAIVIGQKGEKLKEIASAARVQMEGLFGGKVFLEVWVKTKRGWADDERALRSFGYGDE